MKMEIFYIFSLTNSSVRGFCRCVYGWLRFFALIGAFDRMAPVTQPSRTSSASDVASRKTQDDPSSAGLSLLISGGEGYVDFRCGKFFLLNYILRIS